MDNEQQAISETVSLYFTGTFYGNTEQLQLAFHPDAHITGSLNGQIMDWPLTDFIIRVTTAPTAAASNEKFAKEIIFIDHVGDVAMVKARVVSGGYVFTDYITLLKIKGRWVIRNKSFTT